MKYVHCCCCCYCYCCCCYIYHSCCYYYYYWNKLRAGINIIVISKKVIKNPACNIIIKITKFCSWLVYFPFFHFLWNIEYTFASHLCYFQLLRVTSVVKMQQRKFKMSIELIYLINLFCLS